MATLIHEPQKSSCAEENGPTVKACAKLDSSHSNSDIDINSKGGRNGNMSIVTNGDDSSQQHASIATPREEIFLSHVVNKKKEDHDNISSMDGEDQNMGQAHDIQMHMI